MPLTPPHDNFENSGDQLEFKNDNNERVFFYPLRDDISRIMCYVPGITYDEKTKTLTVPPDCIKHFGLCLFIFNKSLGVTAHFASDLSGNDEVPEVYLGLADPSNEKSKLILKIMYRTSPQNNKNYIGIKDIWTYFRSIEPHWTRNSVILFFRQNLKQAQYESCLEALNQLENSRLKMCILEKNYLCDTKPTVGSGLKGMQIIFYPENAEQREEVVKIKDRVPGVQYREQPGDKSICILTIPFELINDFERDVASLESKETYEIRVSQITAQEEAKRKEEEKNKKKKEIETRIKVLISQTNNLSDTKYEVTVDEDGNMEINFNLSGDSDKIKYLNEIVECVSGVIHISPGILIMSAEKIPFVEAHFRQSRSSNNETEDSPPLGVTSYFASLIKSREGQTPYLKFTAEHKLAVIFSDSDKPAQTYVGHEEIVFFLQGLLIDANRSFEDMEKLTELFYEFNQPILLKNFSENHPFTIQSKLLKQLETDLGSQECRQRLFSPQKYQQKVDDDYLIKMIEEVQSKAGILPALNMLHLTYLQLENTTFRYQDSSGKSKFRDDFIKALKEKYRQLCGDYSEQNGKDDRKMAVFRNGISRNPFGEAFDIDELSDANMFRQ